MKTRFTFLGIVATCGALSVPATASAAPPSSPNASASPSASVRSTGAGALSASTSSASAPSASAPAASTASAASMSAPPGEAGSLTMEQAVTFALQHNRDVIAAELGIREAELAQIAAEMYPNPVLSYSVGNLVVGNGNAGNVQNGAPAHPGVFSQTVHNVGLSQVIDVWAKRNARSRVAERGLELRKLEVADVLRDIAHEVRTAFNEVTREEAERKLRHDMRDRYDETVRLSRARFSAGEISEAEFRKVELEGFKYTTEVVSADAELDLARKKLASLLGRSSDRELPPSLTLEPLPDVELDEAALVAVAQKDRPDVRAAERAHAFADAALGAARREALPDLTLALNYSHSEFLASGDNPNTFGVGFALPLPIFDRNQAGVGRAELEIKRAANETARLGVVVNYEVGDAVRRVSRAKALLDFFEGGGMLERADHALHVAEKSYQAGAISLLELLEAQRTSLETRAQYLRAQYDYRQSRVDLRRAIGSH